MMIYLLLFSCHCLSSRNLTTHTSIFPEVACWTVTGERQAARIRCLYLKTVLRQDIGFFDQETNTGVIIESLSSDTLTIQDAIGEKVYLQDRPYVRHYHLIYLEDLACIHI